MSPHVTRGLLLAALVATMSSYAQSSYAGSVSTPLGDNNGIRFGPGRLHPHFALGGRSGSAAIYVPSVANAPASPYQLKPEILMHFRPGFRLDVPGTDVTF